MTQEKPEGQSKESGERRRSTIPENVLDAVEALYERGRYADAHAAAIQAAPLATWWGTRARVLASRLASRLEGDRFSEWLALTAWRADRKAALPNLYRCYGLWSKEGPLAVWAATEDFRSFGGLDTTLEADFLALRARIAGAYHDFELAWRLMDEAHRLVPANPWLWSEKAALLLTEERPGDALEAARQALEFQPCFRPAIQQCAIALQRRLELDEAMAVLESARETTQSAEVVAHLIGLHRERDNAAGMEALLDDYESRALLIEKAGREWLAARRCDLLCLRHQWSAAADQASIASGEYYDELARRLREAPPENPKRVRLVPPKLLQLHNTCGPTSLAMIAGYWNHEATHDTIADAICYDGTHDHSERQWCLDNGLVAREFTLTWESAVLLLDAGFPFALATVEVTSAHLQVVVGYDSTRETLLIQDPGSFLYREVMVRGFLREYALYGPRALVFAPPTRAAELEAMDLPDSAAYDRFFAFNSALHRHDREEAGRALAAMASAEPGHRITRLMEWSLAAYDDDDAWAFRATEAMAEHFPEDPRLTRRRARSILANQGREPYMDFLRAQARSEKAHPIFWFDLACELSGNASMEAEKWKWLRKAHAALPFTQGVVEAWGDHWWQNGQRERATDIYGFASSWAPTDERLAREWYRAEYLIGRRETALDRLRARYRKLGEKSPHPGRTLFWILDDLNLDEEAQLVLEQTLARHPEEGELHLDAARFRSWRGEDDDALRHLAAAENRVPRGRWLRGRAAREEHIFDRTAALATWRGIVAREPTAYDAHAAIARLLSLLDGDSAARTHLDQTVASFPHHAGLHRLRCEFSRDAPGDLALTPVLDFLKARPDNAWAWRELAAIHTEQGRRDEAMKAARRAHALSPRDCSSCGALAMTHEAAGDLIEARRWFLESIQLDVDYTYGINGLSRVSADAAARLDALRSVHAEMLRQVINGDCIPAYRDQAFPLLEPDELLEHLRHIHRERPDLFSAWSALVQHLLDLGHSKDALETCAAMTRRFARLPGAWLRAAATRRALGDYAAAAEDARVATVLNPHWDDAWLRRADYLEDAGRHHEAIAVLEDARKRLPLSGRIVWLLAGIRWRRGEREAAFAEIMTAARLSPFYFGIWDAAVDWAQALGRAKEVVEAARAITRERPGEARSWMLLARLLPDAALAETLDAFDRATTLNPRLDEAWDQKAHLLATKGRYKEALAACRPAAFGDNPPFNLLGREAWVRYRQGDRTDAMRAMRELLEKHPDYHWGWMALHQWAINAGDTPTRQLAQAALQRLAPRDINTLCEVGDTLHREGKELEALARYEEAMRLDPGASYPLNQWLRLRWSRREIDAILAMPEKVLPGPTRVIAESFVVLAKLHLRQHDQAAKNLAQLVRSPERVGPVVSDLADALARLGHVRLWRKSLADAARANEIGMSFASAWIECEIAAGRYDGWKKFDAWIARAHDEAEVPIERFFALLGEHHKMRHASGFFKSPAAPWVHARTATFGQVGYALANASWWDKAAAWLDGAEKRDDAVGWLCTNLMLAHFHRGHPELAGEVARRVLERDLRDHTWPCSVATAALAAALAGDAAKARQWLSLAPSSDSNTTWNWIWLLATRLTDLLEQPAGSKATRDHHAKATLELARFASTSFPNMSRNFLRLWHRVSRAMSRHSGRPAWLDHFRMPLRGLLPF